MVTGRYVKEDGQLENVGRRTGKRMKVAPMLSARIPAVEKKVTHAIESKRDKSDDTMWKHPATTSKTSHETGSVDNTQDHKVARQQ